MSYTLDSNIFINLGNWYPRDVFPTLWDLIAQAASNNEVCICRMVESELARGTGDLISWLAGIVGFVCDPTSAELRIVSATSRAPIRAGSQRRRTRRIPTSLPTRRQMDLPS
ncbi:hypothetical protein DDD63_08555 [Actinobaculum sp. 313]|nr:hypothetical protein DDD63_08555 [Actinobaculum sp. 313]